MIIFTGTFYFGGVLTPKTPAVVTALSSSCIATSAWHSAHIVRIYKEAGLSFIAWN